MTVNVEGLTHGADSSDIADGTIQSIHIYIDGACSADTVARSHPRQSRVGEDGGGCCSLCSAPCARNSLAEDKVDDARDATRINSRELTNSTFQHVHTRNEVMHALMSKLLEERDVKRTACAGQEQLSTPCSQGNKRN